MFYSKLEALDGDRAMSFFGRTLVRIKRIAKRAKMAADAISVVIKDNALTIYLDGVILLQASKDLYNNSWDIGLTNKLRNFLELEKAVVL